MNTTKTLIAMGIIIFTLSSCTSSIRFANADSGSAGVSGKSTRSGEVLPSGFTFKGKASYYADKFDGRQTANGEIFDQGKLTAAHKTIAFGTKLKVTNLKNGKQVIVIVNDRGPFVEGRIIDLSRLAADRLDMIRDGIADVECEVLN